MNRWKGTPAPHSNMTPPPVAPPVIKRSELVAPPIQSRSASPLPTLQLGEPSRWAVVSFLQTTTCTVLLLTAVIGIAMAWQSHSKLRSIYTQTFLDRTPERISDRLPRKSLSALESPSQIASDGVATPAVDASYEAPTSIVEDAKVELVTVLAESELPTLDVVALESVGSESFNTEEASTFDSIPTEADVDMIVVRIPEANVPDSKDIPASEGISESEETIATIAEAPVETTMVSIKASPPDGLDFSDIESTSVEQVCNSNSCVPSRKFGTAIEWAEDVEQAAELAKEQGRFVFLIQVSGNFARQGFT